MQGTSKQNSKGDSLGDRHGLCHSLNIFLWIKAAETGWKGPISFFTGKQPEESRRRKQGHH